PAGATGAAPGAGPSGRCATPPPATAPEAASRPRTPPAPGRAARSSTWPGRLTQVAAHDERGRVGSVRPLVIGRAAADLDEAEPAIERQRRRVGLVHLEEQRFRPF